jgi:hypothetical protein
MNAFPHYPLHERFRTYEDAMTFLEKPDFSLCIPVYIEKKTNYGVKTLINPEYKDAPYEQRIVPMAKVIVKR